MRTTHVTRTLVAAALMTMTVTIAVVGAPPASAVIAPDPPERCGPASSPSSDFVDRISFRKEQMSRDRAVRPW